MRLESMHELVLPNVLLSGVCFSGERPTSAGQCTFQGERQPVV